MSKIVLGILAHVDAGKTTLSEGMLYESKTIRKMGRVDNQDAFFDTYELERARGITIFSKQAELKFQDRQIVLLDTPGHVDFSAEMERTLSVLDYAILVISGADGVQGHTQTLWQLLTKYKIPVFLFINKMDQNGTDKEALIKNIKSRLSSNCIDFSNDDSEEFYEEAAMSEENVMEYFLENDRVEKEQIVQLIGQRKIFPCYFGSALKLDGVKAFMDGIAVYAQEKNYPAAFGARIYKITRDDSGNRLTHMKITGGTLKVKEMPTNSQEKINQIRIYSGTKYESVNEVFTGDVCAVTGLTDTHPGQGLGIEKTAMAPILEPVLTYRVLLPDGCDVGGMLGKLRQLEEEEPQLHIVWNEKLQEIQVQLMGEVQIEILKSMIQKRFSVAVEFDRGNIVYKETILDTVEGVGHFEPLRHYAEVHLLLEPLERGSGLVFDTDCSEDVLDRNWQRLILTHLEEREHPGVLTGSVITDMKITLIGGRAHLKHTEGGDFRQATYRAVRQGLMQAKSQLLEPYYDFRLEIPENMIGRAMTDIERMYGKFQTPQIEMGQAILTGSAPVVTMNHYQQEVLAYTKGHGRITCTLKGYEPCHNEAEVLESYGYDPDSDLENPSGSVFCAHGAGFYVDWYQVFEYMHIPALQNRRHVETDGGEYDGAGYGNADDRKLGYKEANEINLERGMSNGGNTIEGAEGNTYYETEKTKAAKRERERVRRQASVMEQWIDTEEIDRILEKNSHANRKPDDFPRRGIKKYHTKGTSEKRYSVNEYAAKDMRVKDYHKNDYIAPVHRVYKNKDPRETYLLVDGYNIIFAWEELSELAKVNIDGARGRLLDILCNYQGIKKCNLIVVFDAYRVKGHVTEIMDYHNIHVVYTKEAETADQYIEKFAHENGQKYDVTVATSDGLEQIIIRGQGCFLLSARDLEAEIQRINTGLQEEYRSTQKQNRSYMLDGISDETAKKINELEEE